MDSPKVKNHSKHRGISPFNHRRRANSRGESPSSSPRTRGESPFRLRGLSPFRRRGSGSSLGSNDSGGGGGGGGRNRQSRTPKLVFHENARSIVFRDHLRHVTKIVEEDLDGDDISSSSSEESDDDPDLAKQMKQTFKESLRASIRQSGGDEINFLAQSLVPELAKDVNKMHVTSDRDVQIEQLHIHMTPLPELELNRKSPITELLDFQAYNKPQNDWTAAEKEVYDMLRQERATVKTIKNSEWGIFLNRFLQPSPRGSHHHSLHDDIGPKESKLRYNSFFTSTTLLPESGSKMRCYGSLTAYTAGVVFALPIFASVKEEEKEAKSSETWCWPAGYSAKTEFNIDDRGRLINGRSEALVSLKQLRRYNDEYLHKKDHTIAGKVVKGGFQVIPFNEVFVRVGGCDRFGRKLQQQKGGTDGSSCDRSFNSGVGLPVALFMRDNTIEDVVSLFRIKSRLAYVLGDDQANQIPLLYISNEHGIRVLTEKFQRFFWKRLTTSVNPFQNPILEPLTQLDDTKESCLQQKVEELIDLESNKILQPQTLTYDECAVVAGGYGATNQSIIHALEECQSSSISSNDNNNKNKHKSNYTNIQRAIEAGLASAVRCGDYYNARQILILYSHVTSPSSSKSLKPKQKSSNNLLEEEEESVFSYSNLDVLDDTYVGNDPSCPPVINVDRLRSAVSLNCVFDNEIYISSVPQNTYCIQTNSDGLLIVLGAAQIMNAIKDGGAVTRTEDSFKAVEEWIRIGESSVAFRLASWRDLRAAEGEIHTAIADNSKMMAFMSNKAVTNRKKFAQQLRKADTAARNNANGGPRLFLRKVYDIVKDMHSPCLRLELLQYILGLDNRYSVSHLRRSIELAATCLSVR